MKCSFHTDVEFKEDETSSTPYLKLDAKFADYVQEMLG